MGELANAMRLFTGAKMATCISRYPSGRYGLVGSIPYELTEPCRSKHTPQIPPLRVSQVWNTEQEAIDALRAIGLKRFQLADCSWFDETER